MQEANMNTAKTTRPTWQPRKSIVGVVCLLLAMVVATNQALAEPSGWYGGLDLGIAMPEALDTDMGDNDVPTNCDQLLSGPGSMFVKPLSDADCRQGQDTWNNRFDLDTGILAGVNFGYARHGLRIEAEYFHRRHSGEDSPLPFVAGGKEDEFSTLSERISDLRGHHFFGNVYYDFHNVWTQWTPYVGAGIGWMHAKLDYSSKFQRNADQAVVSGLGRNPNAAGTLTTSDAELSDTLWGYQLMLGSDYALNDQISIGIKARYAVFNNDFKDDHAYDLLRSHASKFEENGETVRYKFKGDELDFWGVSLNLKYFF